MADRPVLQRPPAADMVWLAVALVFLSASGPMIAACAAPALAIALWRCLLGSAATASVVLTRSRHELATLTRRELLLIVAAGLLLGGHFATWIPSLRFTSVAASTAMVATQPVFAALIARARGRRIPLQAWIGIAIAGVGVLVITGVDSSIDSRHLIGDVLALIGAFFAAAYVSVCEHARKSVSTSTMTMILYASSAALLLVTCVVGRQPLWGWSWRDWALIVALTVGAQLLGHTIMNKVLVSTSATVVSTAILFEAPGAIIIAAIALGQIPPLALIPALALMMVGVVMVIRSGSRDVPTETSPI
ncbi:MAG: DMT family transporter [Actinomycetes bacterium]